MKIGVFDSGIGGKAVAQSLRLSLPEATVTTASDRKNLPYGDKSPAEVVLLTEKAIGPLLGSDVVVIACNTAITLALPHLKEKHPRQKFIGIEPMIKPATELTQSQIICVCATPATLASQRYSELKQLHAMSVEILEPDCSNWADMIEQDKINTQQITETIETVIQQGADVIVLGCTHYHWIEDLIKQIVRDRAVVIEPSEAIARRVRQILVE